MNQMKRTRKLFALLLAAVMVFGIFVTGCNKSDDGAALEAALKEKEELTAEISSLKKQLEDAQNATPPTSPTEPIPVATDMIIGINTLLYPKGASADTAANELSVSGASTVMAIPQVPVGLVIDHWTLNGKVLDVEPDNVEFPVDGNSVIEAVLRDELKVTSVNATMRFLDDKGKPTGDKFTEYVFEYDDENVSGGLITVYVEAVIPSGYVISHWLLNDVPYHFARVSSSFTVYDLNETTVYEPIFRKASATPTPTPTTAPVETVLISCTNCTFTGGGMVNARTGSVPKGSTLTVTGTTELGNPVVWMINGVTDNDTIGRTSITRTVNSDTTFRYTGYN